MIVKIFIACCAVSFMTVFLRLSNPNKELNRYFGEACRIKPASWLNITCVIVIVAAFAIVIFAPLTKNGLLGKALSLIVAFLAALLRNRQNNSFIYQGRRI